MNTLTSTEEESLAQIIVPIAIKQWKESEFPVTIFPIQSLSLIALAAIRVADSRARIFSQRPSISIF